MLPRVDDLIVSVDDLDPIGQNFAVGEKEGFITPHSFYGTADHLFGIIPEADGRDQLQLFIDQIARECPADKKPLSFRRALLPGIWCSNVGAGQKIPIDPLLLNVEMAFVAAHKKGEEKNRKNR